MELFDGQLPKSRGLSGGQKRHKWANTAFGTASSHVKTPGKLVLYLGPSKKAIESPVMQLWDYLMANYLNPEAQQGGNKRNKWANTASGTAK